MKKHEYKQLKTLEETRKWAGQHIPKNPKWSKPIYNSQTKINFNSSGFRTHSTKKIKVKSLIKKDKGISLKTWVEINKTAWFNQKDLASMWLSDNLSLEEKHLIFKNWQEEQNRINELSQKIKNKQNGTIEQEELEYQKRLDKLNSL